jgi:hypothetical protein
MFRVSEEPKISLQAYFRSHSNIKYLCKCISCVSEIQDVCTDICHEFQETEIPVRYISLVSELKVSVKICFRSLRSQDVCTCKFHESQRPQKSVRYLSRVSELGISVQICFMSLRGQDSCTDKFHESQGPEISVRYISRLSKLEIFVQIISRVSEAQDICAGIFHETQKPKRSWQIHFGRRTIPFHTVRWAPHFQQVQIAILSRVVQNLRSGTCGGGRGKREPQFPAGRPICWSVNICSPQKALFSAISGIPHTSSLARCLLLWLPSQRLLPLSTPDTFYKCFTRTTSEPGYALAQW